MQNMLLKKICKKSCNFDGIEFLQAEFDFFFSKLLISIRLLRSADKLFQEKDQRIFLNLSRKTERLKKLGWTTNHLVSDLCDPIREL